MEDEKDKKNTAEQDITADEQKDIAVEEIEIEEEIEIDNKLEKIEPKRNRPDFRVLQLIIDKEGKSKFEEVGAMWIHQKKDGKSFYVMRIGKLKLFVFKNE
ncbi:MAG: hypothetical protein NZ908_00510 [Candidatus Micrarchaeota archaeon]|nr:hypothetical protein [Candidatus Micrarchaeota archaeon]MCX8154551.1 hypothetical protein [Candidatus Micrarchaeota archaeon]